MEPSRGRSDVGVLPQPRPLKVFDAPEAGEPVAGLIDAEAGTPVRSGRGETDVVPSDVGVTDVGEGLPPGEGDLEARPARPARPQDRGLVAVLGRDGRPLSPTRPSRARELLTAGRAQVVSLVPLFTIRLLDRTGTDSRTVVEYLEIGIDPGSRHTGIAVFRTAKSEVDCATARHGLAAFQVDHRGATISRSMKTRAQHRHHRRSKLGCRPARFKNRARADGWLPPSKRHLVDSTAHIVAKLCRVLPIAGAHVETSRWDMQLLENPQIHGDGYRHGPLHELELCDYLIARDGAGCVYCDATDAPLEADHVVPRISGGPDRASSRVLACKPCNRAKGSLPLSVFVTDPIRRARIRRSLRAPLRDAAAVSSTRPALLLALRAARLEVREGFGWQTKQARDRSGLPKTHANDALAVGTVGRIVSYPTVVTIATATGRGQYRRTLSDRFGFPRLPLPRKKRLRHGFATGDTVRAVVPRGKHRGTHVGRVAVRESGSFNLRTSAGVLQGIRHTHMTLLRRADGWSYARAVDAPGSPRRR